MRKIIAIIGLLVAAAPAAAQNINVDFGQPSSRPASSYAGAGLPGFWNSIKGEHTSISNPQIIYALRDVNSQSSGVTLHQFGGQDLLSASDPSLSGDDALLLGDALLTHSSGLESCLYIDGLENGTYEVITYAWMPNEPGTLSRVRHDFTPGVIDVGGTWTGQHVEGVTYARHMVEVTNGTMGSHSGIPTGGDTVIGAALNGIQLRRIVPCPSDTNDDGGVDVDDLIAVILAWGTNDPSADVDHSGNVDVDDLVAVILDWGVCD